MFKKYLILISLFLISADFASALAIANDETNTRREIQPHYLEPLPTLAISKDHGGGTSRYIVPNEFRNFHYKKILREKGFGTLLAVGSFRALFDIVMGGGFDLAILLDISHGLVAFNRINLDAILALKSTGLSSKEQRLIYWKVLTASIDKKDVLSQIPKPQERKIFEDFMKAVAENLTTPDLELMPDFRAFGGPERDVSHGMTYWSSDAAWEKIQLMHERKRIITIVADVTGNVAMRSIAEQIKSLRDPGLRIGIVDLSNIPEYLQSMVRMTTAAEARAPRKLVENLKALPFRDDAAILFTEHGFFDDVTEEERSMGDRWRYCAMDVATFLSDSDQFTLGDRHYAQHMARDKKYFLSARKGESPSHLGEIVPLRERCLGVDCMKAGPYHTCNRCKKATYCSRDCQASDWPEHQRICVVPEWFKD